MRDNIYKNKYGHFSEDGREYVITRPDTPRPWTNIICPGDYGIAVSQTGGGYSWKTHASLNRLTRWNQDLITDEWGKYLYIRDEATGKFWSPTWKPACAELESYECRHGFGTTKFISRNSGILAELTLFVPPAEPMEVWVLTLKNLSGRARKLSVWSYFEWCLGDAPDSHREFHKTFLETEIDKKDRTIFASKRLWTIPNEKGQHWNKSWDFKAWHSVNLPVKEISGSKDAFIGAYGNFACPRALVEGKYLGKTTGKWDDSIASICVPITLAPGKSQTAIWTLGVAKSKKEAAALSKKYRTVKDAEKALGRTSDFWDRYLETSGVITEDAGFDLLLNRWLKYQAISGRIWGRTGYFQAGGAIGYRDQLQDSQIFLHIEPERTRRQILLHAAHQFTDGTVQHWWHPITNEGHKSRFSDDLLWLPFLTANYLKETGDYSILKEKVPFLKHAGLKDEPPSTLFDHCHRSIEMSLKRRSKRGIPLIGTGDWNDGLNVAGWDGKGESLWVAEFLYGILNEFCIVICNGMDAGALSNSEHKKIGAYKESADELYRAINREGWDGKWYWAATTDDGTVVGSDKAKQGKIHLNPQTWAVMNGLVPKDRMKSVLDSTEKRLYRNYGPLLLSPAYSVPDERIGYLTRYAPGVRENGGLYTHAGTWAIMMECFLKRNDKAWKLYQSFSPIERGKAPDLYQAEPYVTPGNVDGPDSPLYGRGGWTWYTGSAAWLYRIMSEWIIGIRPEWEGLKIDPCVPSHWKKFEAKRVWRGQTYYFVFQRDQTLKKGTVEAVSGGKIIPGGVILPSKKRASKEVIVKVLFN